jgi:superfamily II DNA or RNA helicase
MKNRVKIDIKFFEKIGYLQFKMQFIGFIYAITSDYLESEGLIKIGSTLYPVSRMYTYNTGDPPNVGLEKRYLGIWQVKASSKRELVRIEKSIHLHFHSTRERRRNGNYTEWFKISFDSIASLLNTQNYILRQLSFDEVRHIQLKSEGSSYVDSLEVLADEIKYISEENELLAEESNAYDSSASDDTMRNEFFATFLSSGIPRRIQSELWDLWKDIAAESTEYKGIIQWPTGVGKTVAMMMLFVLSATSFKKKGLVFRGLLVAPKNDIFDTIIHHIRKLSKWGIEVFEGHRARLSSLDIPSNKPVLITATHTSLTDESSWVKLPAITHIHYDEVHRITGEEFYDNLQKYFEVWNTQFLTGTSATPLTCTLTQNKKLLEIFGKPLQILHHCSVEEAICEGWIAKPRFGVTILSNTLSRIDIVREFVLSLISSIQNKMEKGIWRGGKVIAYLPLREEVLMAIKFTAELNFTPYIYKAIEDDAGIVEMDDKFVSDEANGTPRILFACERYREGSDIKGVEMTATLMGNTIGANVLLQIIGRALRKDYDEKEGWCMIVRPSDEGTTEDDVFESIVLQIMEFVNSDVSTPGKTRIKEVVENFFGSVSLAGKIYNIDETVERIQSMYIRKSFESSDPREKYEVIRRLNMDMGLQSKSEYGECAMEHPKFIHDPKSYFKDVWVSWYHFLGVDTRLFPETKYEWIQACRDFEIATWADYKEKNISSLPKNPGEMYEDYTNWDNEFGITDEVVW